jgi:hypothetical protein
MVVLLCNANPALAPANIKNKGMIQKFTNITKSVGAKKISLFFSSQSIISKNLVL